MNNDGMKAYAENQLVFWNDTKAFPESEYRGRIVDFYQSVLNLVDEDAIPCTMRDDYVTGHEEDYDEDLGWNP